LGIFSIKIPEKLPKNTRKSAKKWGKVGKNGEKNHLFLYSTEKR
jgi:hypothetical protein